MIKNLIIVLIILFASILTSLPLVKPGLNTMHDDQQVARLFLFDKSLASGQFPVRWVDELGFGYGYPLFVFYPPFVYMLGEIFHLTGYGFIDSIKIVFYLSILLSGITMYVFIKDLWGRLAGLTSSLFYMVVPYRALDVYVRGALAESFSFVWLPAILWSLYKLYKTSKSIYIYTSAIFLAILMITHNLIFLPFMLLLPIFMIYLISQSESKKKLIVYSLLSFVYSLLLSAFFWIPALLEKKYTIVDQLLLANLADYKIHFVYPQQLWNWTWGFGGSSAGLLDGISFKIGKIHILTSIAAVILAFLAWLKNRHKFKSLFTIYHLPFIFFIMLVFSAFMTVSYSKFIWDIVKPLAYLQFPWRFLTFTALFSSILAGGAVYLLRLSVLKVIVLPILLYFLFAPNLKFFKPQAYRPDLTNEIATSKRTINWNVSRTSFEYLPKGIKLVKNELGANEVPIQKHDIPQEKVEVSNSTTQINNLNIKPHKVSFSLNSPEDSQVRVNVVNFPGWQAHLDNSPFSINDENPLKLISLSIPKGNHNVKVEFKNTKVRSTANLLSLFSIALVILLTFKKWLIFPKN